MTTLTREECEVEGIDTKYAGHVFFSPFTWKCVSILGVIGVISAIWH